jgi:hypothetical protein
MPFYAPNEITRRWRRMARDAYLVGARQMGHKARNRSGRDL